MADRDGETILANARLVLPDGLVVGSVRLAEGRVAEIDTGAGVPAGAADLGGELLMPGLVELHTDNLEKHLGPRPGVHWPPLPALMAHDAQLAAAGITTVLDALRIGDRDFDESPLEQTCETVANIVSARDDGLLRADHLLHLRCEVGMEKTAEEFELFADHPLLRLVSLMDHAPGQRQFANLAQWKLYYGGTYKLGEAELEEYMRVQIGRSERYADGHRRAIAAICQDRGIGLASHDDATEEHVLESASLGLTVAEFPTTKLAAATARTLGLRTIAGAPNVVRGKSHSGNVAALDLAQEGLLDALSSDYVPVSLLHAAFILHRKLGAPLHEAVDKVAGNPARMVGLDDRGQIAIGQRADLIQVRDDFDAPIVRRVWREGIRVV